MDPAKLQEQIADLKRRIKKIEEITGIDYFCEIRDEKIERSILDYLVTVDSASEDDIQEALDIELDPLRGHEISLLFRDHIEMTDQSFLMRQGQIVVNNRRLRITEVGKNRLESLRDKEREEEREGNNNSKQ